jgi:hypothetical protein
MLKRAAKNLLLLVYSNKLEKKISISYHVLLVKFSTPPTNLHGVVLN